ncbi:CHAT domain-containing protein [Candidatus Marithioploca araucensis]|uniref:CHAT domain-containing protein n=1 Tax=Candidatus Marithioploca araucensis TaxID=70273 RepID=A0ABT7VR25_9GAMM|nr:CHAT domain-containing protein [Candidatus Marithioploca araucensis]
MRTLYLGILLIILSLGVRANVSNVSPDEIDRLHAQAKKAFFAADYDIALEKWQTALNYARTLNQQTNISKFLVNLGAVNYHIGQYQKAIAYYQQAVVIDHELGDKSGENANLNQLGLIHYNLAQYQKALSYYLQAIEIQIDDKNGISNSLSGIGMTYDSLGEYRQALTYYQRALKIKREIRDKTGIAYNLSNIGIAYENLSDYSKALAYFQESLEIQQKIGDQRGIGNNLTNIGTIYSSLGQYSKALNSFQQALQMFGERGDSKGIADNHSNIAVVYDKQGEYSKALTHFKQALQIQRNIDDRFGIGNNLSNIGIVYRHLGDFPKALTYYEQAIERQIAIGDKRGEANTLSHLGVVYENLGQFPKALTYYLQALEIQRKIGEKQREGNTLSNIGVLYYHLRHFEKSRGYFLQALTIWDDIGDKWGKSVDLLHIGATYYSQDRFEPLKALKYHLDALKVKRELGDKRGESAALSSIGTVYGTIGEKEKALSHFQAALQIDRKLGDKIGEAAILSNLARVYQELGFYEKARTALQESITTLSKLGSNHLWYAKRNLAALEVKVNENNAAITDYEQALDHIEQLRAGLIEKADKFSFMSNKFEVYDELIALLQSLHEKYPKKGYDRKALEIFERKQGRVFLEEIGKSGAQRFARLPDEVSQKEQLLTKKIAKRQAELVNARNKSFIKQELTLIKTLTQRIAILKKQQQALQTEIKEKYPAYYALKYPQPATVAVLQNEVLQPGEVILVYGIMKEKTALWVISSRHFAMLTLPVGEEELNENVAYMRDVILNRLPELVDEGYPLYQKLIPKEIRKYLAEANTLYIVPTGSLYMLPFETLVTDDTNYFNPRYLIEDYAIIYLSSASLLKVLRETKRRKPRKKFLAFANPAYIPCKKTGDKQKTIARARSVTEVRTHIYRKTMGTVCFPLLPETANEANSIAAFFNKNDNLLYLDQQASRDAVFNLNKKGQISDYRYVLFAVHGLLPNQVTGLAQSSLVLSNAQGNNGYLTMADAFTLKLNADFINLSACNTGGGKKIKGEGIIGLTRAFLYAGTSTIAVTLWSVESSSAENLSIGLFENLKEGKKQAEAIRQIKIKMIKGKAKQPYYRQPFYWAPFVMYGNGG